ncbi:MAG: hypothetical protein EB170_08490 [Nitrosopumilaceae archaeon]|nr:hypothetical protein [Nitrosopumilaceae archaeon]
MNAKTRLALSRVDWTSPNTHVFFSVQLIGVMWFVWLLFNQFVSDNPLLTKNWTIIILILTRYFVGMWFVTAWRHRYFAHRSFRINPRFIWIEPIIGFICSADAQRGVCQWAAEHIYHHKYSDKPEDHHSCKQNGTQWCHWLWVVKKGEDRYVDWRLIPNLAKSKSLRWIEERQWIGIVLFGGIFSLIGAILSIGGFDSFLWNFLFSLCVHFFSTTLLWHGTFLINSAMHIVGTQRYDTGDESRNSLICAILTMGEGWHNNHHWDFPTLEKAKELKGSAERNSKELYWQGKTFFERCFDWSGISIWIQIELGILRTN